MVDVFRAGVIRQLNKWSFEMDTTNSVDGIVLPRTGCACLLQLPRLFRPGPFLKANLKRIQPSRQGDVIQNELGYLSISLVLPLQDKVVSCCLDIN